MLGGYALGWLCAGVALRWGGYALGWLCAGVAMCWGGYALGGHVLGWLCAGVHFAYIFSLRFRFCFWIPVFGLGLLLLTSALASVFG